VGRAGRLSTIRARADYGGLNRGQEALLSGDGLFRAANQRPERPTPERGRPLATHHELEGLYGQIEQTLERIAFVKSGSGSNVHRAMRGILQRAALDQREARMLRGIFVEVVKYVERQLR